MISPVPRWDDAISWDGRILESLRPIVLDVGAAGKGLLVDLVSATLREHGIDEHTVDASGDILHRGARPLRIGLEHPLDPTRATGVATLTGGALCASASNRRAWAGTHHVIDAITGRATNDVIATWVTAPDAMTADGSATALFFADADRLASFDIEWVRMRRSGRLERSAGSRENCSDEEHRMSQLALAPRTAGPRQVLDRVTGRVTMYRLVTLLLMVIAAAAVLLSLVGQVSFSPGALLASLAAALFGTIGANVVTSLLLRARPHTESSVITALLVFFLMYPSTDAGDLGVIALAGALATVSKYLLAWRGRHIFNPAAAGVALVAVLQFGSAVWWVATGALLPLVAIGAFLVLWRTRRMPMALVFVLVSTAILTVRLAAGGQGVLDALSTALVSYPVVFFVGFMLSEPLTLAPRRWQQLVLAGVVGVLFTIPYNFGPVSMSFEFALLIGNLLAFVVGQRRGIRLSLLGSRRLTPTAWEFSFQPEKPVAFRAGQYLELTVPHARADHRGSRRVFSISSAPDPAGPVTVAMRMPEQSSSFKRALVGLAPGATVRATSVGGDFLLPRDTTTPVLLVAGGIGVTPFLSQLGHDLAAGVDRDVLLVYSVGSADELAFADELADVPTLLVAPDVPHTLPPAWRWIGAGPVTEELLEREVPDAASRAAYVSGAPAIVTDVRTALRRIGVRRVTTDYFSGY